MFYKCIIIMFIFIKMFSSYKYLTFKHSNVYRIEALWKRFPEFWMVTNRKLLLEHLVCLTKKLTEFGLFLVLVTRSALQLVISRNVTMGNAEGRVRRVDSMSKRKRQRDDEVSWTDGLQEYLSVVITLYMPLLLISFFSSIFEL